MRSRNEVKWIEVWIDAASAADYVLVLRALTNESLELIDPQKQGEVVEMFDDYEEAVHWLNEDEYDLVEGRYALDT